MPPDAIDLKEISQLDLSFLRGNSPVGFFGGQVRFGGQVGK
jgi:hypothetical protein